MRTLDNCALTVINVLFSGHPRHTILSGFVQNFGEIIPTSLPELPIQLRDLRNNEEYLKAWSIASRTKPKNSPYIPSKGLYTLKL